MAGAVIKRVPVVVAPISCTGFRISFYLLRCPRDELENFSSVIQKVAIFYSIRGEFVGIFHPYVHNIAEQEKFGNILFHLRPI
jgi:hypothetical protein